MSGSASSEKADHIMKPFHGRSFFFLLFTVCSFTCQSQAMLSFFIYMKFKRYLTFCESFCKVQAVSYIQQFILIGMPDKTGNRISVYIT